VKFREGIKSESLALRSFFPVTFERVMLLIVLAGFIEVGFTDRGMAVETLLVLFLGELRRASRKWNKQKSHQTRYRQSS
jgi:hypothetical protein